MFNVDVVRFRDECSNVKVCWIDYEIVQHLAGLLYSMEDDYQARNPQKIIDAFLDKFRKLEGAVNLGTVWGYMGQHLKI